jgi:probable O-glycosylation ligase (exosortase A-associated)
MTIRYKAQSDREDLRPVSGILFSGLLLVFWLEYARPGTYFPLLDTLKLSLIVPVAVFAFTLLSRDGRPHSAPLKAPDTKWFLLLVCLFLVQFVTAPVRLYVYETLKGVVGYLLVYYVIIRQVESLRRLKAVMGTLVLVHVLVILLYPDVVLNPDTRHYLGGTFLGDGNDFSWSACIAIPFALFLGYSSDSKFRKVAFYGIFVLLILAVIGTQSRGASLALVVAMAYLVMKSRRKSLALAAVGMLVAMVLLFAPDAYFDRMSSIKDYETEGSAQGRILAWKTAANMALDHPLTGVGAGHFGVMFGFKYKPADYIGPYLNAHSIYFLMLGEFGFPGLLVLLGLIIGNVIRNERVIQHLRSLRLPGDATNLSLMVAMQTALLGYAVGGMFLGGVFYPHLFVLAGLMQSARLIASGGVVGSRGAGAKMATVPRT